MLSKVNQLYLALGVIQRRSWHLLSSSETWYDPKLLVNPVLMRWEAAPAHHGGTEDLRVLPGLPLVLPLVLPLIPLLVSLLVLPVRAPMDEILPL